MDTPIPYDKQMHADKERAKREEENKSHDSNERDITYESCGHSQVIKNEIICTYNNEFNYCGVPCPITKGK